MREVLKNEAMEKILAAKRQHRKQLASLPFEEKMEMVKRLRKRAQELASNPLRQKGG